MKLIFRKTAILMLALLLAASVHTTAFASENGINFGAWIESTEEVLTVTVDGDNAEAFEQLQKSNKYFHFTTDCTFPEAYAVHEGGLVDAQLEAGKITFPVHDSGDYQIINGAGPVIARSDSEITITVSQQNDRYLDFISVPCTWNEVCVTLAESTVQAAVADGMVTVPVGGDGVYTITAGDVVENRLVLDTAELGGYTSVWIDGVEMAIQQDGASCYVDLPDSNAHVMTAYTYHSGTAEDGVAVHGQYPVSMKVWALSNRDGIYTVERIEELDDILLYSGMSIRIKGKLGIRMITSVDAENKGALTGDGLAGYTLQEYGTVIALNSKLDDDKPLALGKSYVASNYAYRRGVADPVFANDKGRVQYTNVLVNFTLEQCKEDIAMRPYMILQDAEGNEITIYGGIVCRSIGYIALQNRGEIPAGTEAGDYIRNIIHAVYGNAYDEAVS